MKWTLSLFLLVAACARPTLPPQVQSAPLGTGKNNSLYVVVSDFTSTGVRRFDLARGTFAQETVPSRGDAVARWSPELHSLIVLNRLAGDHLSLVSPDFKRVTKQVALPENSNAQDLVFLGGNQAYISLASSPLLLRKDLQTGDAVGAGIDLSGYADADGLPEATYLHRFGNKVLVTLQRLDTQKGFVPAGKGAFLVIDPSSDKVEAEKVLEFANPVTDFKEFDGDFFLGEAGVLNAKMSTLDGGIERFDAKTFDAKGIVITEKELGGDILNFEILSPETAVAIISTPETQLVEFNPATGKRVRVLKKPELGKPAGEGYRFSDLVVDRERGLFYVTDRDLRSPSVLVFGLDAEERVRSRISLAGSQTGNGLPPFRLVLAP